jgi:hypothetical protein
MAFWDEERRFLRPKNGSDGSARAASSAALALMGDCCRHPGTSPDSRGAQAHDGADALWSALVETEEGATSKMEADRSRRNEAGFGANPRVPRTARARHVPGTCL